MPVLELKNINLKKSDVDTVDDFSIMLKGKRKALECVEDLRPYCPADKTLTQFAEDVIDMVGEAMIDSVESISDVAGDVCADTRELLSWLHFSYINKNDVSSLIVYVKPNDSGLCVRVPDPYKDRLGDRIVHTLIQQGVKKGFQKKFQSGFNGRIFNASKYYVDEVLRTPTLATYLQDNIRDLLSSEEFFLDDEIVPFTNDLETLAFSQMLRMVDMSDQNLPMLPTPTIDRYLNAVMRKDQIAVFRAWLYATTQADSKIRQVPWLVDLKGNSGKSTFISAFSNWFESHAPNSVTAINSKALTTQFGSSQLYGKRIAVDADTKNTKLLKSQVIHKATGGDATGVEFKGENSFKAKIHCFFLFASNYNPVINTSDAHEFTRLIYLPMKPLTDDYLKHQCVLNPDGSVKRDINNNVTWRRDNNFEEMVAAEFDQFMLNSKPYYEALSGKNTVTISETMAQEMIEDLSSMDDAVISMDSFIDECLDFGDDYFVESKMLSELLKERGIKGDNYNNAISLLEKYLKTSHNIVKARPLIQTGNETTRVRGFMGMKIKMTPDVTLITETINNVNDRLFNERISASVSKYSSKSVQKQMVPPPPPPRS